MAGRSGNKREGLLSRLFWLVNVVAAVALLGSYLSSYVNPYSTTVFAFLGMAYHYLLGLNILFGFYWLFRGKRKLLLSAIVILIGYNPFVKHIQIMPGREAPIEGKGLKVLSYNAQNMAHSNIGKRDPETRKKILSFLKDQKADIICLQEYTGSTRDSVEDLENLQLLTKFPVSHPIRYNPHKYYRTDALMILSNYPYHNSGALSLQGENHNFGGFIDIVCDKDTIRIYNLHLESIRLQHEDYQFVEDVSKGQTEGGSIGEGSKSILRKLHLAMKVRSKQTEVIKESLDQCPYPLIICGDFNDTPLSYAYDQISDGLQDAFVGAGYGLGNTFAGNLPPIRIDFIFHDGIFTAYEFEVHKIRLSDHYPVSVFLGK